MNEIMGCMGGIIRVKEKQRSLLLQLEKEIKRIYIFPIFSYWTDCSCWKLKYNGLVPVFLWKCFMRDSLQYKDEYFWSNHLLRSRVAEILASAEGVSRVALFKSLLLTPPCNWGTTCTAVLQLFLLSENDLLGITYSWAKPVVCQSSG